MAQEGPEFKIKGAAANSDNGSSPPPSTTAANSDEVQPVNADKNKSPVAEAEETQGDTAAKADAIEPSEEDLKAKYKWFKCRKEPEGWVYFRNQDLDISAWIEPAEPYWVYDADLNDADPVAGLQQPVSRRPGFPGYVPALHGKYDENAPYAQYHNELRAAEEVAQAQNSLNPLGVASYGSTMAFNRFTGHAQRDGLGPERHTDEAKATRQQNAFFDVTAAANAHEGRSLKAERREKKISKKELKKFQKSAAEKKHKKQREWLLS